MQSEIMVCISSLYFTGNLVLFNFQILATRLIIFMLVELIHDLYVLRFCCFDARSQSGLDVTNPSLNSVHGLEIIFRSSQQINMSQSGLDLNKIISYTHISLCMCMHSCTCVPGHVHAHHCKQVGEA